MIDNKAMPTYLHDNKEFVNYWKDYFNKFSLSDDDKFEIYIDFPFCTSLCKYCAFGTNLFGKFNHEEILMYEESILSLINDMYDIIPDKINMIYFGGGTPSLWSKGSLRKISKSIKGYHNAYCRTMEVHPINLTDDFLNFIVNEMNIDILSIGIQSFDIQSNKMQRRIPTNINTIKHSIEFMHSHGKYVNIDLVALFNYDSEYGWKLFKDDINYALENLNPDEICLAINFSSKNFFNKAQTFRKILAETKSNYPEIMLEYGDQSLSLDMIDIINHGEDPYRLFLNKEYMNIYLSKMKVVMDKDPNVIDHNIVMGFGGDAYGHSAISKLPMIRKDIISGFDFNKSNKLIHKVKPMQVVSKYNGSGDIPYIQIGKYKIDTNIN